MSIQINLLHVCGKVMISDFFEGIYELYYVQLLSLLFDIDKSTKGDIMKKLLASFLLCFAFASKSHAELSDQIDAALLNHVETFSQFTTDGEGRVALLDSVFQVGKLNENYLAAFQAGYSVSSKDAGTETPSGYLVGVSFHLNSVVKQFVSFSPNWTFLNSLEYGPGYYYSFADHHAYGAFNVGLAFGLNPK